MPSNQAIWKIELFVWFISSVARQQEEQLIRVFKILF